MAALNFTIILCVPKPNSGRTDVTFRCHNCDYLSLISIPTVISMSSLKDRHATKFDFKKVL